MHNPYNYENRHYESRHYESRHYESRHYEGCPCEERFLRRGNPVFDVAFIEKINA